MVQMKDLLEAGVHFGHQSRRWNPKAKPYIFATRKNIHIIDLQRTLKYFESTMKFVREASEQGKTFMFVGTKKQASDNVKEYAEMVGMPYVNHRWLGGMLTNFDTIKKSVRKLELIEEMEKNGQIDMLAKKEALMMRRKKDKLERDLNGIRNMKKTPDILFVIDAVKEHIAVKEAKKLGMTIVGPLDSNCDPDDFDYFIPANDDAMRSIILILKEAVEAIREGRAQNEEDIDDVAQQAEESEEKVEAKEASETKEDK